MYEIFIELQTGGSAFFRMELRRKYVIPPYCAAKRHAVRRFAERMRWIGRYCVITVYEIEITIVGDPCPHRVRHCLMDTVPAHMGHLEARSVFLQFIGKFKAYRFDRQQTKTNRVAFLTPEEQH